MAPTLLSPSSAISRAAPAVSPWTSGAKRCFFRKLRHCGQRLDVALHRLDRLQRGAGQRHQAVLDALEMLGDDLEPGVRQQAVQVGDAAGDRVLDRDHRQLRLAGLDGGHRRLEGRARQGRHVGKGRTAGHVGVGARLRPGRRWCCWPRPCCRGLSAPLPSRRSPERAPSADCWRVVSPAGSPTSIARRLCAEERKTPQYPALATFRRASARP